LSTIAYREATVKMKRDAAASVYAYLMWQLGRFFVPSPTGRGSKAPGLRIDGRFIARHQTIEDNQEK
jgi:hypothetical protein